MSSRRLMPIPPPERSFWDLLPRRNLRRALFLVVALLAVLAIKHGGGMSFRRLFDGVAPAPAAPEFRHIEVRRPVPPPAPRP